MNAERKKQLKAQYLERRATGGVYRLVNRQSGRYYLGATDNMESTRGWFAICQERGGCPLPAILRDWTALGAQAFLLEEVDLIEQGKDQTMEEFAQDLRTLLALWSEKLPGERY